MNFNKSHIWPWVCQEKLIQPSGIVLHWWGEPIEKGGIEYLDQLLAPPRLETGLSVQFAVLADGTIHQCVEHPNVWCRHAKDANASTIGIEIQGRDAADLDANELQMTSVVDLVLYLKNLFQIENDFRATGIGSDHLQLYGVMTHQMADAFCKTPNGKVDVHLGDLVRVLKALR